MIMAEQRIAIAEWCGWHDFQWREDSLDPLPVLVKAPDGRLFAGRAIPDYPNSLEAMYEAEEKLDVNEQVRYARMLRDVYDDLLTRQFAMVHAPAHVRAKVLLELIKIRKNEKANAQT